jgi:hypothetical protein
LWWVCVCNQWLAALQSGTHNAGVSGSSPLAATILSPVFLRKVQKRRVGVRDKAGQKRPVLPGFCREGWAKSGQQKGGAFQCPLLVAIGVATLATSSPFKAGADESAPEGLIYTILLMSGKWFIL